MKKVVEQSAYAKVAAAIAEKIASGEIPEGEFFTKRSLAGAQYSVSPETVRRALGLLSLAGILETRVNAGYLVKSRERAIGYIEQYQSRADAYALKVRLRELMLQRDNLNKEIRDISEQLLEIADRFQNTDRFRNYEFKIRDESPAAGKTIWELQFRQETGGTIIAIQKAEQFLLSPGPDVLLEAGDTLIVICEYRSLDAIQTVLGMEPAKDGLKNGKDESNVRADPV